jgi:hypothetical protein
MIDRENRQLIMHELGGTIDELVRDLYSDTIDGPSMVQEPEITSRICQRVEDRLDGQRVGDYILRVGATLWIAGRDQHGQKCPRICHRGPPRDIGES